MNLLNGYYYSIIYKPVFLGTIYFKLKFYLLNTKRLNCKTYQEAASIRGSSNDYNILKINFYAIIAKKYLARILYGLSLNVKIGDVRLIFSINIAI